jgi:WD40 repeat protein
MLLSGGKPYALALLLALISILSGNDNRVVVWNLSSGEMIQELCVPSAGFISMLTWIKVDDRDESAFVFGASEGNIYLYERGNDVPLFNFTSITLAHAGAIESLAWDPVHCRLASVGDGHAQVWKFGPDNSECFAGVIETD